MATSAVCYVILANFPGFSKVAKMEGCVQNLSGNLPRPGFTSPPLGADAPRRPLSVNGEGEEPSAARLGGEVNTPTSNKSPTTFARTPLKFAWSSGHHIS